MSGESSKRSSLIDVTYQQLHSILSSQIDNISIDQVKEFLTSRKAQLGRIENPFGSPADASKKKIESGSVTLADGVTLRTDDTDKEYIFAISREFEIDQVQALVLLRSFFYNEGIPTITADTSSIAQELVDAITPFYLAERLAVLRVLIPLFRAKENPDNALHHIAADILPEAIPNGVKFAEAVIEQFVQRTKRKVPEKWRADPKAATSWAKHNVREQLVLLEVLFWTMWGYVPCSGPLVVKVFDAAYSTNLGSNQVDGTLLLDEESVQLLQDLAALWIIITVEVLELENLGEPQFLQNMDESQSETSYLASPQSLKQIHGIVTSNGSSQFACTFLAWTYVLSRLADNPSYASFLEPLSSASRSFSKNREPIHTQMLRTCLSPDAGLFQLILSLLTKSPLFVTAVAWKTGSSVTDPNAIAFRSVLKGLIISLVEMIPVEHLPDFDSFIEVWVTLYGRSESQSVTAICAQFWQADWQHGFARRAIFDVARSRFPIQLLPLLRLLRSMSGSGFLDTDTLSTTDHILEAPEELKQERDLCSRHVFYYFDQLSTYSQVVPLSACSGAHALYERQPERYGTSASQGLTYINLKPIKLPGGSTLPAKSVGRVISGDSSEHLVICWQHEHSGWKLILELLTDYVNRKRLQNSGPYQDISFAPRGNVQTLSIPLQDIGVNFDEDGGESLITEALDLVRSLIYDNPAQAEQLMQAFETGPPVVAHTMTESQAPDLVQLTTMILEEALSRSNPRNRSSTRTQLITSAMSVLAALLALPTYSNRVWLYIRSTTALFGSDKTSGFASIALAAERTTGHYTMTLSLLYLVQQLFREASVTVLPDNPRLLQLKEEVLLRAARFVHTEIWVEHLSWKYTQLGDRFEIGRRLSSFYAEVLEHAPPALSDGPFLTLSQTFADALLFRATTSSINPLISAITSGGHVLRMLYASRRLSDARRLIFLLEAHLHLSALLLNYKQQSTFASTPCLLEQTLCSRIIGGAASFDNVRGKADPIDVIASYVKDRDMGSIVPLEAMNLLYALLSSLSTSYSSPPTIIGHLIDPEATVLSFVKIVQHPYDDLQLRDAIWRFIALAVDKEPALASLFVTGKFRSPNTLMDLTKGVDKGKGKEKGKEKDGEEEKDKKTTITATEVAKEALESWNEKWEANPQLLASVLRFVCVVWEHGLEHKAILGKLRETEDLWEQLSSLIQEDLGPVPPYEAETTVLMEGVRHADVNETVLLYAYRILAKAYAVRIVGLDIEIGFQLHGKNAKKPTSFEKLEGCFKDPDQLSDLLSDASASAYSPELYDKLVELLNADFPGLKLEHLSIQKPKDVREFGDGYSFNMALFRTRLRAYPAMTEEALQAIDTAERSLLSVNMNLSLTDAQQSLAESWIFMMLKLVPYLRGDLEARKNLLAIAATQSYAIASESRSGEVMAMIHDLRLKLLLAVLELAWFALKDVPGEVESFIEMTKNLRGIILNEAQPPGNVLINNSTAPFHRTLLQIIYYSVKQGRSWSRKPKILNGEQRVTLSSFVEASLSFVIEALRIVFMTARTRGDTDVDRDMELLVAVFEQSIRSDINISSTFWLVKCQETDVIRTSLDLYAHIDLVGLTDLPLLHARKQPLYAPHLLQFHMALAGNVTAAERLASEGVLTAYSNNFISSAISAGQIDVVLPEFPGERSPAHTAYTSMLAIVASIITALGRQNHYFDAEVCGFVQLYGDQISRALTWTIGDPITFPLLEETEQVVNLFYAIAANSPSITNPTVEKILRFFTTLALNLLQQLNYAITHPNHLASLLEPVTSDERSQLEREKPSPDPLKRPLVTQLLHRLFRLSSNVVGTLVVVSKADSVLLTPEEEWPLHEALIVPHSKVVLGEPASLGTLLELGNCTLDVLRDLVNRPPNQNITTLGTKSSDPLDVRRSVITARKNLEGILLYAATQLVMWLSKPEFEPSSPEMDVEDSLDVITTAITRSDRPDSNSNSKERERERERRGPRASMTMAERLRRGMTSEMAVDLKSLLNKARPVIVKSSETVGKDSVDIVQVLINFLQDHVA